jgi:hypothetical protein
VSKTKPRKTSGYTHCACRDCFDVAVSGDQRKPELCNYCDTEGCDASGSSECNRADAYHGIDDER